MMGTRLKNGRLPFNETEDFFGLEALHHDVLPQVT